MVTEMNVVSNFSIKSFLSTQISETGADASKGRVKFLLLRLKMILHNDPCLVYQVSSVKLRFSLPIITC